MTDEYRQALAELEMARTNYDNAEENFESTAYHELKAAEERVMALIREKRVTTE